MSFRLAGGSTVGSRGGVLSVFVYTLLPLLTVAGVWEETITGSLHSQIALQPDALHGYKTLNGFGIYCHIWGRHSRRSDDTADKQD